MKVKELLHAWKRFSDSDRIDIYAVDWKIIELVKETYKEVTYEKICKYLDCDVEMFFEKNETLLINGKETKVNTLNIRINAIYAL